MSGRGPNVTHKLRPASHAYPGTTIEPRPIRNDAHSQLRNTRQTELQNGRGNARCDSALRRTCARGSQPPGNGETRASRHRAMITGRPSLPRAFNFIRVSAAVSHPSKLNDGGGMRDLSSSIDSGLIISVRRRDTFASRPDEEFRNAST